MNPVLVKSECNVNSAALNTSVCAEITQACHVGVCTGSCTSRNIQVFNELEAFCHNTNTCLVCEH